MKGVAALLVFFFALGVVGAVEQGADLSLMWWTLPALGVLSLAACLAEHGKHGGGSAPANKKGE